MKLWAALSGAIEFGPQVISDYGQCYRLSKNVDVLCAAVMTAVDTGACTHVRTYTCHVCTCTCTYVQWEFHFKVRILNFSTFLCNVRICILHHLHVVC